MKNVMHGPEQAIKIAILAMGGEGGGVLADWIVDLGEHNGYIAQTTSVPGVAQRTGATIYYVELFAAAAAKAAGVAPVLALMPLPGDVDLVLASELMEAGRAVQRGLVTSTRSTLICSTHRVYAIAEKMAMGDGRADAEALRAQAAAAARRFIGFDMAELADQTGSLISAVLFGALAGAGTLPFSREQFEATIERGGVGVKPSLKAFEAGFMRAQDAEAATIDECTEPVASTPDHPNPQIKALLARAGACLQGESLRLATEGLRRTLDYQDLGYAAEYMQRLERLANALPHGAQGSDTLMVEAARHLALWMTYEDTFRVAQLKTRDTRFARVRSEVRAQHQQLITINEYLHPRLEEIADSLPAALARWLLASGAPRRWVERVAARGRVLRTSSLRGFLLLSAVSGGRRWRRSTLRHAIETERIDAWLEEVRQCAMHDIALATEILRCQRLVKGYGDTHARGWQSFSQLRAARRSAGARMTAPILAELRQAALLDEHGRALQEALQRHRLVV